MQFVGARRRGNVEVVIVHPLYQSALFYGGFNTGNTDDPHSNEALPGFRGRGWRREYLRSRDGARAEDGDGMSNMTKPRYIHGTLLKEANSSVTDLAEFGTCQTPFE
jgi:hypothetical protein